MTPYRRASRWIPALGALLVPLWAPSVHADDLIVPPNVPIGTKGDVLVDQVVIGTPTGDEPAVLTVEKFNASHGDHDQLGWVRLRARTITIYPNGTINATGQGFSGSVDAGGGMGAGYTPPTTVRPAPGGGGAHFGYGGAGTTIGSCLLFAGAEGGDVYAFDPTSLATMQQTGLGSSGGTGHSLVNDTTSLPGGAGGGLVILEAYEVRLLGHITADGAAAPTNNGFGQLGVAAGGGSGGMVIISAQVFEFERNAATPLISAAGGLGATDALVPTVVGGGGGGGRVEAHVGLEGTDVALFESLINIAGGVRADLPGCSDSHPGGTGARLVDSKPACIDADRDGHDHVGCGGDDCDDSNPLINPDINESCNGIDDNCVGGVDEGPDSGGDGGVVSDGGTPLCSEGSGQICLDGACVRPEDVVEDPDPVPPVTLLSGGLCSMPVGMHRHGSVAAGLLAIGGAGWALRRRRRAKAQERR